MEQPDRTTDPGPGSGLAAGDAAPAPFKHTRWQNFVRDMWLLLRPAQTGVPPYATPEEREAWRQATLAEPLDAARTSKPPTGYRITEYRDAQGYLHRSLVPDAPPEAAADPKPPAPGATADDGGRRLTGVTSPSRMRRRCHLTLLPAMAAS